MVDITTDRFESRKVHAKEIEAKEEKTTEDLLFLDFVDLLVSMVDIARNMEKFLLDNPYSDFNSYCGFFRNEFLQSKSITNRITGESVPFLTDHEERQCYSLKQGRVLEDVFNTLQDSIRKGEEYNPVDAIEVADMWYNS